MFKKMAAAVLITLATLVCTPIVTPVVPSPVVMQVQLDPVTEFYYTLRAAMAGDADSQFRAGFMYGRGIGIYKSYEKACKWFYKAAMQNHPAAQRHLGLSYFGGLGVKRNVKMAFVWLTISLDEEPDFTIQKIRDSLFSNLKREDLFWIDNEIKAIRGDIEDQIFHRATS